MRGITLRAIAKEFLYGFAYAAGLPHIGRRHRRDSLSILTYHSFGASTEHPYINRLPPSRLIAQLDHLARHFEIVSLEDGLSQLANAEGAPRGRPMLVVTVDDGYSDNYEILFPILRERTIPATIFVATDYMDSGRLPWPTRISALLFFARATTLGPPWNLSIATTVQRHHAGRILRMRMSALDHAERDSVIEELSRTLAPAPFTPLRPLTWSQVRAMSLGGIKFGSHTQWHGWLDRVSPAELDAELSLSRRRLETETDAPCHSIAYPNGNWNAAVAAATAKVGYRYALTQDAGVNRCLGLRPLALCRTEIPFNEMVGTFACRVSGVAI